MHGNPWTGEQGIRLHPLGNKTNLKTKIYPSSQQKKLQGAKWSSLQFCFLLADDTNFPSHGCAHGFERDLGAFSAYILALVFLLLLHREVSRKTWS